MAAPPAWPFFRAAAACRNAAAAVGRLPAWWAREQFAGGDGVTAGRPAFRGWWLVLAAAAALLFFGRLGTPLQEPQEARYAEIPRQMLASGSWLVPVLHGRPYLDKPPLLYWLVMGCYRLLGVHDWAARLVPGAAGFLTVCALAAWMR
ncbi:MAG TPA: hypothetical protein VFA26_14325, partial [Gemmataceae bacterium]|nr:hypothetical protein [Gemmataceae bacterium]